jgi:hypothetical protein
VERTASDSKRMSGADDRIEAEMPFRSRTNVSETIVEAMIQNRSCGMLLPLTSLIVGITNPMTTNATKSVRSKRSAAGLMTGLNGWIECCEYGQPGNAA